MEKISDIVREMRDRTDLDGRDMVDNFSLDAEFGEYGGYDALKLIRAYADRIEAAHEREDSAWRNAVLDFCNAFTMVYEPPFKDCPALLAGAFLTLCDKLGIEQVKIGGEDGK